MRAAVIRVALLTAVLTGAAPQVMSATPNELPSPPPTPREDVRETLHGVEIVDPYRWLEDGAAPRTREWVAAQEAHARAVLDALPLRSSLRVTMEPFFRRDSVDVPWPRGGRLFFTRRLAKDELESIVVRDLPLAPDRVLVDPLAVDPSGATSVTLEAVSQDGTRVAHGVRAGGADEIEIRFIDVATGREAGERLPRRRYTGVVLAPGGTAYYATHGDEGPRAWRHVAGTDPATDAVIFGEGVPPSAGIAIDLTPDGRWLVATTWHGSAAARTEIHVKPLAGDAPWVTVVDDIEARFVPSPAPGRLIVETNWKASRGRVLEIDLARPSRENWKEIVPESRWPVQSTALVGGLIAVQYLEDVRPVVRVFDGEGRAVRAIEAPGFGSMSNLSGSWDQPQAFFSFSSWDRPPVIESVDLATWRQAAWWTSRTAFPSDRFVVEQRWFTSSDGTRVPMFLGRAKDMKPSGDAPVLMTGYGGFLISQLPAFSPKVAAWLQLGGLVALPSLRGGAEFGETWHEQGMRARKQQTFDDLHAAARFLVSEGWTTPSRIGLSGRSNGGLLVGAAVTQQPALYGAAVCGYPLLDMLRYDKFLVAKFWVPEYGSPDDPEQFRWLLGYSPYHRVKAGEAYPAVLFVTGDSDTRVAPLHARKMAALLQASTSSGRPVLLHDDAKMGHAGSLPAEKELSDALDEVSFLAWQLGLGAGMERDKRRNPPR